MSKSDRVIYICQECGRESNRWEGRCPDCRQWNTMVEMKISSPRAMTGPAMPVAPPQELSAVTEEETRRTRLGIGEFNRVLGGGIVDGSLVLISGDPGIGKSTLLLQVAASVASGGNPVVYVTGEETARQVKLRADRLGIRGKGLFIMPETDLEAVLQHIDSISPRLLVIDSIQTVFLTGVESVPGSISQVRECTMRLMQWAKRSGIPVFITGHVTKEGAIAGPRVLEHIVDVVLYLEGEQFSAYRLLRCVKNRFGSTNEVGVFEMKEKGMAEVDNPSRAFLSRPGGVTTGSAVVPTIEGSRPLLVEIQALTTTTTFGMPRRTANGVDYNRLLLIIAVLTKRVKLKLGNQDILVNVTGGLKIGEPAADMGIALAIASSFREMSIAAHTAVVGELGLSGELRPAAQMERRLQEAARMGFTRCIVPEDGAAYSVPGGTELIKAANIREAVNLGLEKYSAEQDMRPIFGEEG